MNYRDAIEYREYCLSYYRDSKKAVSLSPTKYSIQIEIETTDTILIYLHVTSIIYHRNGIRYKGPE